MQLTTEPRVRDRRLGRRAPDTGADPAPAAQIERAAVEIPGSAVGALLGTFVITALMEAAQAAWITRMSIPFMLWAMVSVRSPRMTTTAGRTSSEAPSCSRAAATSRTSRPARRCGVRSTRRIWKPSI